MKIQEEAPLLDQILESSRSHLGDDVTGYRNHCYRVLNFCLALSGDSEETLNKVSIAVAFHDLGIWVNNTWDYLDPSENLAREYLIKTNQSLWCEEIEMMIEQHHKITKYKGNSLVEYFRQADWIDVTKGVLKFGLPASFVREVLLKFPNAGFHQRLIAFATARLKTHPFSPMPMMRF
jgi:hypothetical protein